MKTAISTMLFLMAAGSLFACRFTIREIGYTRLNIETYIVVLEADTVKNSVLVRDFAGIASSYSVNSNINYRISHIPGMSPELKCLNSRNEIITKKDVLTESSIRSFYRELLFSPLQKTMYDQIGNAFAFIVGFYEADDAATDKLVDKVITQFRKLVPNLDKKVDESVVKIIIPSEDKKSEELILRSIGVDPAEKEPVVVIFYGKGRLTGKPLTGKEVTMRNLLNQLVTLGTDCECGIDLSPLLQRAVPFKWDDKMSQAVANMLDVDVENPMVLTEMGRILSKEPLETGKSEFSFVPQTIDLDAELAKGKGQPKEVIVQKDDNPVLNITLIVISVFVVLVIGVGVLLFLRRR